MGDGLDYLTYPLSFGLLEMNINPFCATVREFHVPVLVFLCATVREIHVPDASAVSGHMTWETSTVHCPYQKEINTALQSICLVAIFE